MKNAPVVLLDKATSSPDPKNEVFIQQAISALVKDKTVIVIADRLQSVCNADRIALLDEGNIAESAHARSCSETTDYMRRCGMNRSTPEAGG